LPEKTGEPLIDGLKEAAELEEKTHAQTKKDKVSQAEDKAFQENPDKFKNLMKEIVENKMTKCGVKENELGSEEKNLYTKLKNKEISDKDQIKSAKQKLVEFIGNKEVDKEIEKIKKEIKAVSKSDKQKKQVIKDKLLALLKKDNIYFEKRESDIKSLIKELESVSSNPTTNPASGGLP